MSVLVAASIVAFVTPALAQVAIFTETWEGPTTRWRTADANPLTVTSDTAPVCSTKFQRETVPVSGGRVFTTGTGSGAIAVVPAQTYCLTAWIRGTTGTQPFVAVVADDGSGAGVTPHWIMGQADYPDDYGGTAVPVTPDGNWHWYAAPFPADAAFMLIAYELWEGAGTGSADFDDITMWQGACPSAPAGVDSHTTCGGATPVCNASGACVAAPPDMTTPPPPADMTGTPPADMTGTPPADMTGAPPADMTATAPADMTATPGDMGTTPADMRSSADLSKGGGGGGDGCDCSIGGSGRRANLGASALLLAVGAALLLRRRLRRADRA